MNAAFDILGLGCVAIDDLLYVDAYPPPDAKTQVLRRERQCGGLTATALVAAARLGASCAYVGTLGTDELSEFALNALAAEGVDTSGVVRHAAARPIHSIIVVDQTHRTRNVFSDRRGFVESPAAAVEASLVRRCKVLFVDHVAPARQVEAARVAREAGIPVVADFERDTAEGFEELFGLVDHLVLSREFAAKRTGEVRPADAAGALMRTGRRAVVVTAGGEGAYWVDAEHRTPVHCPSFGVEVVDTTGCGDVFHGVYAAGLARGVGMAERVRRASAAAALKATRRGGQAGIPRAAELDRFLASRRASPETE